MKFRYSTGPYVSGNVSQAFEPLIQRTHFKKLLGVSSVWAALVLFDSAVFALTAYKGIRMWRNGYRGLPRVLLRDGACYEPFNNSSDQ